MTASRRVIVTGVSGQLGAELMRYPWPDDVELIGLSRAELDLSQPRQIRATVAELKPDIVVNAGAYTNVDKAEDEESLAAIVNGDAVGELALAADDCGAFLLQVSTDYVFDGSKSDWYNEDDPTSPMGAYGRTKLIGEQRALEAKRSIVLRTAWVYGALGNNFVSTMLRVAAQRDELGVVADQVGCPTATRDLADAIVRVVSEPERASRRLYHAASEESASWFEFARAILADQIDSGTVVVRPLMTHEYKTPTARPANSRLDGTALHSDFGVRLQRWSSAMPPVRKELLELGKR